MFKRYEGNPILKPIPGSDWEALMVYNAAAVEIDGKVNIIYRGQSVQYQVSKFGLAVTKDGFNIDERLPQPIYENDPSIDEEALGYEDPRATVIGDRLHLCYTSYGIIPNMFGRKLKPDDPPEPRTYKRVQIGMTSISLDDFRARRWNWEKNHLPFYRVDNKNCFLFPEKVGGRYVMFHRISPHIWSAYSDDLKNWRDLNIVMQPREEWEYYKLGTGAPAIRIDEGWLLIYHAVDNKFEYRLGLALLDADDPTKALKRGRIPIMVPETEYEKWDGVVPNVVFTCGAVLRGDTVLCYYGGADTVMGVATAKVSELMDWLDRNS